MLKQGLKQKLTQKLSPQQIQFIQLLQLNTTEFEQRLDEELEENPALEEGRQNDDPQEDIDQVPEREDGEASATGEIDISDYLGDDERDDYIPRDPNKEDKEIPISDSESLYDSLDSQLGAMELSEREEILAGHLIGMIGEDGYLRRPLKNIVYDLVFLRNIKTDEEELEKVIKIVQQFEPAGVGARDLRECLLLQLERKDPEDKYIDWAKKVVRDHLNALGNHHYDKLMKSLKIDRDELKKVMEVITHLNPKPGGTRAGSKSQYINPDFIVKNQEGELEVTLNNKNAPSLNINKSFQETLQGYKETKNKSKNLRQQVQFIKQKLDSAKWFVDAVRQRQETLLMTMKTILSLQKDYFLTGEFARLKPMVLKDVADRIGMDVSTISRVANSKYVETDFGIYPLKEFFSEAIKTKEGKEVSNRQVKQILQETIEKEDKGKPLTDEQLTNDLKNKGYNIARRTVAKYREHLNIPVARQRKQI